jgi:hypothetical protein
VSDREDKRSTRLEEFRQGSEQGFDIGDVEQGHVGEGGIKVFLAEGKVLLLVGCIDNVISNYSG